MSSKRRRKKARVPGLIITIILLLLVAEFVGLLAVYKAFADLSAFCSRHCIYDLCIAGGNADRKFQEESPIYYRCNSGRSASCNFASGQSLCDEHI